MKKNCTFAKKIINPKKNMNTLLFVGKSEIIVIALVVLLLFGGKKIPELMRGLGKGVKSFKDGVNGVSDEINSGMRNASEEKQ